MRPRIHLQTASEDANKKRKAFEDNLQFLERVCPWGGLQSCKEEIAPASKLTTAAFSIWSPVLILVERPTNSLQHNSQLPIKLGKMGEIGEWTETIELKIYGLHVDCDAMGSC